MAKRDKVTPVEFIETTSTKLETIFGTESEPEHEGAIIHVKDDNGDNQLYIGEDQVTDQFIIGGESVTTPTRALGGLEESTIGDLKNNKKTVSQILIDMLRAPVSKPTSPSGKPSLTLTGPSNDLLKVGSVISSSSFSVTPDRGKWSNQNVYAGEYNGDTNYIIAPVDSFDIELSEGVYKIKATGTFKNGSDQQDNYGNSVAGYVGGQTITSNTKTYYVVEPILINTDDITVMKEQPLVNYLLSNGVTFTVNIPDETDGPDSKFKIYLPGTFSVFEVKQYSELTKKYDIDVNMVLIDGEESKYIRTNNELDTLGSTKYEIKLKR